jgi:hypothetical protein
MAARLIPVAPAPRRFDANGPLRVLARVTYAWLTTGTEYGDLTNVDDRIVWSGLLGSAVFQ